AFSPDGNWLASRTQGEILVRAARDEAIRHRLRGDAGSRLAWGDDTLLLAGPTVWNIESGEPQAQLLLGGKITTCATSGTGFIALVDDSNTVTILKPWGQKMLRQFTVGG